MRRLALLGSILLLCAGWAVAQSSNEASSSMRGSIQETTLQGCLNVSGTSYTLTLPSGAVFQLTGNTALLKAHVGETLQVQGVASPVAHVPGSMSEGTQTAPTLSVTFFQKISGICVPPGSTIR